MVLFLSFLFACTEPSTSGPESGHDLELLCPGDPGCETATGPLYAGASKGSVVPDCFESFVDADGNATWSRDEGFLDCGCDRLCPGDEGYPGADEGEEDGVFQAIWVGGFQQARPATGVRGAELGPRGANDGLWARGVSLRQGDLRVAVVAIDAVGWMYDDVLRFREAVAEQVPGVDHLIVHSTHVHQGPDTMGIWGPALTTSGYDADYAAQVRDVVVEVVREAVEAETEVTLELGHVDVSTYHPDGMSNLIRDSRDPWIVDPNLGTARFVDRSGQTVASWVNFANHPETLSSGNTLLTSDYVHALRETVESGVVWESVSREGVGGVSLFINGALGGMMTSLGQSIEDPDGAVWREASWEKADQSGQMLGAYALDAMAAAEVVESPNLSLAVDTFKMPVVNQGFQAMFLIGVFEHRGISDYDPDKPLDDTNMPSVSTEVDLLQIGDLQILTIPGEPLPELVYGGYDGSLTPVGESLVDPGNPLPPDLTLAPAGPYWFDKFTTPHGWVMGLGNDELGYLIPPYDFVIADVGPYLFEADGDHYEETNSLGPDSAVLVEQSIDRVFDASP